MSPFPADAPWGWEGVAANVHGNIYAAEPRSSMDVRRSQHVQKLVKVRTGGRR